MRYMLAFLLMVGAGGAQAQAQGYTDQAPTMAGSSVNAKIESQRDTPAIGGGGIDPRDPTANVLNLLRAATQRQDDLREASERFILAGQVAADRLSELRWEMSKALRDAESERLNDLIELRADYQNQLAAAEAKRIDAIRTVDVNAVQTASERAVEQANVLAQQVSQSAETLRTLVSSTAASVAQSQDQLATSLTSRISALEQTQYVGQGRQAVSDPALTALVEQVKVLASAQATRSGQTTGSSDTIAWIFGAIGALVGLGALGAMLFRHPGPHPAARRG